MKTKRKAKIEFKKTKAGAQKGAWRYTIKGANGEILVPNEGYTSKQDAERGVDALTLVLFEHVTELITDMIEKAKARHYPVKNAPGRFYHQKVN